MGQIAFGISSCVSGATLIGVPLFQCLGWLREGQWKERDIYFLLSEQRCQATEWQPLGAEGQDLCRQDFFEFSDWAGLNTLINGIADIHLAFFAAPVFYFCITNWFRISRLRESD